MPVSIRIAGSAALVIASTSTNNSQQATWGRHSCRRARFSSGLSASQLWRARRNSRRRRTPPHPRLIYRNMIHLERHPQRLIERNSRITIIHLRQEFRRLRRSQIPLLLNHIVRGGSPQREFLLFSIEQFLLHRRLLNGGVLPGPSLPHTH